MIDVLFWCYAVSCLWAIICAVTYEAGRKSGKLEGELETLRQPQMRVSGEFLRIIDDWRRKQPDLPPRAEAIRRLIEAGLHRCPQSEEAAR